MVIHEGFLYLPLTSLLSLVVGAAVELKQVAVERVVIVALLQENRLVAVRQQSLN